MSNDTATAAEYPAAGDLRVGDRLPHLTTGGQWRILAVYEDGSIKARSDMRAVRTLKPEAVAACLAELAAAIRRGSGAYYVRRP